MTTTAQRRTRYYKLLAIGQRELCMDDDAYRQLLARHGATEVKGRISATTLPLPALSAVIDEMVRLGFKPRRNSVSSISDWRKPRIAKIVRLWNLLADAGVVRHHSEVAMAKWCSRLTGVARLDWATSKSLNDCIEGLKDWARRERVRIDE